MPSKQSTIIGIVPARYGSTRLPGKSLLPLCGKPLIQWVWEAARGARRLDDLLVATDDERIAEAVQGFGGTCVMTRADHPSGTDRVAEAAADRGADIIVNIQGDEPLLDPALVDRLADAMVADPQLDMGTAAVPLARDRDAQDPAVVKVVCSRDGHALYFSRAVIPHVRDADTVDPGSLYRRHVGLYAYRAAFLRRLVATPPCALEQAEKLEQLRALYIGGRILVLTAAEAGIGVDTPRDVPYVEERLRATMEGSHT